MSNFDDFDRQFERAQKFAIAWMVFCGVAGVSLLVFAIWVVFKLLTHFGVI